MEYLWIGIRRLSLAEETYARLAWMFLALALFVDDWTSKAWLIKEKREQKYLISAGSNGAQLEERTKDLRRPRKMDRLGRKLSSTNE